MKVYLLRHGKTAWNAQQRYQGQSDIPLSPEGEAELILADFSPERIYVSPMKRARRTAELVFPHVPQCIVEEFIEMNFGAFEGRNYMEMEHDKAYRSWVDGGCVDRCPGGEDWQEFSDRVCRRFERLLEDALASGKETLVVLAHGGIQLALMEAYALPERDHFSWMGPCAGGYVLTAQPELWKNQHKMLLDRTVQYTKGATPC